MTSVRTAKPLQAMRNRLQYFAEIDDADIDALEQLARDQEVVPARETIIERGDKATCMYVIEDGWAARCRDTADGSRQIINFMIPGDFFDPMGIVQAFSDHRFETLTDLRLTGIDVNELMALFDRRPRVAAAFWWMTVQEEGILREQIVRVGRRTAIKRTAHLLLELLWRLRIAQGDEIRQDYPIPLRQTELADCLGLSHVHMNRTLRQLQRHELIGNRQRRITVENLQGLAELAHFDTNHLHLMARDGFSTKRQSIRDYLPQSKDQ